MSNSIPDLPAAYRVGIDLLRDKVGEKSAYEWDDHKAAGLPMIVACTHCTMTMAGASALIDVDGYIWCADCAETRGA
ncbi:hypothetical protein AB0M79_09700 [Polymorphospora sp. NPDC051019]|uniref:hypothetical protein n=1 Tax=Polymorphospora sp. NPDC051019 TaxID=3155725 RepID=UPI003434262B